MGPRREPVGPIELPAVPTVQRALCVAGRISTCTAQGSTVKMLRLSASLSLTPMNGVPGGWWGPRPMSGGARASGTICHKFFSISQDCERSEDHVSFSLSLLRVSDFDACKGTGARGYQFVRVGAGECDFTATMSPPSPLSLSSPHQHGLSLGFLPSSLLVSLSRSTTPLCGV